MVREMVLMSVRLQRATWHEAATLARAVGRAAMSLTWPGSAEWIGCLK